MILINKLFELKLHLASQLLVVSLFEDKNIIFLAFVIMVCKYR
jgi:hypothetical protein